MTTLSTGQPSTLGSYRDNCDMLGLVAAMKFFDKKILEAPNGMDEEVVATESQMMSLIAAIEKIGATVRRGTP